MDRATVRTDFKRLVSQAQAAADEISWHRAAFRDIEARLGQDSGFPCVFSKNAFRKQLLKFIFVEDVEDAGIQHLAEGVREYVEVSREWDNTLDTAYPLVVIFSPNAIEDQTVEGYHAFGWQILQKLHEIDGAPWPDEVASDPNSHGWAMCFDGMPLFCNMSSPAHQVRRSRNLGAHFVLVINPRERFDIFAGDNPGGRKVRANIRNRIGLYDGTPHSLQLGSYGAGGVEWWQYGLIEENIERTDSCPFTFKKR